MDRRSETRYVIDKPASIKVGLLSSLDARVADLSASGMKLIVPPNSELQKEIRVSVPELKIKGEKYKVVHYQADTGTVRLCLMEDTRKAKVGSNVDLMVEREHKRISKCEI